MNRASSIGRALKRLPWVLLGTVVSSDRAARTNPDAFTLYAREVISPRGPDFLDFTGLYDSTYFRWMTIQGGLRVSESEQRLGRWGYKLELTSGAFLSYFKASVRLTRLNDYVPDATRRTFLMQRLLGDFQPFEEVTLRTSLGLAEFYTSTGGSTVLPVPGGVPTLTPIVGLTLTYHDEPAARAYSLTYANFDVFDPYPIDQPFVQIEADQDVDGWRLFGYARYRWSHQFQNFHSLYLSLGVVIPYEW